MISNLKIDLIVNATNPLSLDYLPFFAMIESWKDYVDTIIIVDGGTTDGSFKQLSKEAQKKIKIIKNQKTIWDISKPFSPNHINTMLNEGIKESKADWVFLIFADYILKKFDKKLFEKEIDKYKEEYWIRFNRQLLLNYYELSKPKLLTNNRGTILLNLNKCKKLNQFPYMMGLNDKNTIFDYPIFAKDYCGVEDDNKDKIIIPRGSIIPSFAEIKSVEIYMSGHFFYTFERAKFQRKKFNENFDYRATGKLTLFDKEIEAMIGDYQGSIPVNYLMKQDYPDEFRKLIFKFHSKDKLGFKFRKIKKKNIMIYKILRHFLNYIFFFKGRGLFNVVSWHDDIKKIKYFNYTKLYLAQDKQNNFLKKLNLLS